MMNRRRFLLLGLFAPIAYKAAPLLAKIPLPPPARRFVSDAVALQLERIHASLPQLFERDNALWTLMEQRGREAVSSRSMRIPLR